MANKLPNYYRRNTFKSLFRSSSSSTRSAIRTAPNVIMPIIAGITRNILLKSHITPAIATPAKAARESLLIVGIVNG